MRTYQVYRVRQLAPLYNGTNEGNCCNGWRTMTFWKITLSYDGTAFHGWQVQPGLATVQGTLSAVLEKLTGEHVLPQGSGRTDAGVHALGQVASFALEAPLPEENLFGALNRSLPQSVRVLRVEEVGEGFHARHSAMRKSYEYRIFERRMNAADEERVCSPFVAPYVWSCRWAVDVERMKKAAEMVCGAHDFTSFGASDPDLTQRQENGVGPNPVKTMYASTVVREEGLLRYRVTGSGFLHHMVRNLVGTLVEVGRGSIEVEEMQRILAARDRTAAGPTAPAQGLFLMQVEYGVGDDVNAGEKA
ncbi:MAG: tRNA pseudouridine(38-40) synthase TruA [Acidobacteriaceae bacterium]